MPGGKRRVIIAGANVLSQLVSGVVVETQVYRGKSLLQYALAREEAERGSLAPVGWAYQNLAVPFEIGSGYLASGGLRKGNDSVVQEEVDVVSIDGGFTNLVDLFRVEAYAPQFAVQRKDRTSSYRQGLRRRADHDPMGKDRR